MLAVEAERNLDRSVGDVQQKVRLIAERGREVADPPHWASLARTPALQAAARALFVEGCRRDSGLRPRFGLLPKSLSFDRRLIRDIAKSVSKDASVHASAAHGCVLFINVAGA